MTKYMKTILQGLDFIVVKVKQEGCVFDVYKPYFILSTSTDGPQL
jgi:hypothetical protein